MSSRNSVGASASHTQVGLVTDIAYQMKSRQLLDYKAHLGLLEPHLRYGFDRPASFHRRQGAPFAPRYGDPEDNTAIYGEPVCHL